MKKFIKIIITGLITAIIIVTVSFSSAFAATLNYNGFEYNVVNNYSVSITGYQNNDSSVVFPNKIGDRWVLSINYEAFRDNDFITSLDFSKIKNLETIGYAAFINCTALESPVEIPDSVSFIGSYAFMNCTKLPSVVIKTKQMKSITDGCFCGCNMLQNVTLEEGIESIGNIAFGSCTSLNYVNIPKSVTNIHERAFYNDPEIVLGVYRDSYALQYAEENEINHIILDGDKTGDVNGDGVVDILDATEIQKYAAESTDFTEEQFELGDINKDGYCDVIDALLVQKSVIGVYEIPQNIIRY